MYVHVFMCVNTFCATTGGDKNVIDTDNTGYVDVYHSGTIILGEEEDTHFRV